VPYAFGLCGHGNIQFIDALHERQDDIKTISVHHESVCGFMADAYYRVKGQPVATFTSCGPGSMNLPIALATAYLDSVPFLAVGNVPTSQSAAARSRNCTASVRPTSSTVRASPKGYQPTRGEQVMMMRGRPEDQTAGPSRWCWTCRSMCSWRPRRKKRRSPRNGAPTSVALRADPDGVKKTVDMLCPPSGPTWPGVKYGSRRVAAALAENCDSSGSFHSGTGAIDTSSAVARPALAWRRHQANGAARQADVLLALGVR
jgi:acetolactate synthase-1/2/3 large subunit